MDIQIAAERCFAADYADARAKFLDAAKGAGAVMSGYANPATGPSGEALSTDCAWIGSADASRVLVAISATHGGEGFCGSGAEVDFLRGARPPLPHGVAALVVHAINPFGFAWLRRVTEEGVDLNRNFTDFAQPLPENPGYDALADALVPDTESGPPFEAADARLMAYRAEHGERPFQLAVSGGQYRHPKGLFYGGTAPIWSRRTTESIVADFRLAERDLVAVVDFHTGLGPFGYGEPICDHAPGSPGLMRAKTWYGPSVTEPAAGNSTSLAKDGLSDFGWQRMLGDRVSFVALEFGTYPLPVILNALRVDHWLHRNGPPDWTAPRTRAIKAQVRQAFYPDTPDWREMVLFRARQVLRQALLGLGG